MRVWYHKDSEIIRRRGFGRQTQLLDLNFREGERILLCWQVSFSFFYCDHIVSFNICFLISFFNFTSCPWLSTALMRRNVRWGKPSSPLLDFFPNMHLSLFEFTGMILLISPGWDVYSEITWGQYSITWYLLLVTEAYTHTLTHSHIPVLYCLETRPILLHSPKVAIISLISLSPSGWPFAIFCQKTRYRPFVLNT